MLKGGQITKGGHIRSERPLSSANQTPTGVGRRPGNGKKRHLPTPNASGGSSTKAGSLSGEGRVLPPLPPEAQASASKRGRQLPTPKVSGGSSPEAGALSTPADAKSPAPSPEAGAVEVSDSALSNSSAGSDSNFIPGTYEEDMDGKPSSVYTMGDVKDPSHFGEGIRLTSSPKPTRWFVEEAQKPSHGTYDVREAEGRRPQGGHASGNSARAGFKSSSQEAKPPFLPTSPPNSISFHHNPNPPQSPNPSSRLNQSRLSTPTGSKSRRGSGGSELSVSSDRSEQRSIYSDYASKALYEATGGGTTKNQSYTEAESTPGRSASGRSAWNSGKKPSIQMSHVDFKGNMTTYWIVNVAERCKAVLKNRPYLCTKSSKYFSASVPSSISRNERDA